MIWDDPYRWENTSLAPGTIVQAYRARNACALASAQGHPVVVAPMGAYYLRGDSTTWQKVYSFEPYQYCDALTNSTRQALVLGGEVAMWGEQADASDLDRAIWPRAAAAAERWWTPLVEVEAHNTSSDVGGRLANFRCLLVRRGVGAAPMGQTVQQYDRKTQEVETKPGAFSGLSPWPGSCSQGAGNRSMQQQ